LLSWVPLTGVGQQVIPVWGDGIPAYHKPHTLTERESTCWGGARCVLQVVRPTLTIYTPPGQGNGTAVLILPGGGYEAVAVYHEGYEIAEALAESGSVAAVLKYRLPNPETATHPQLAPLSDVRRALRILRERQAQLGFAAARVGVMGFSAGGHLAAQASLDPIAEPLERPDFSMLIYGVTRMTRANREWLEETLFHRAMTPAEVAAQTLLERVTADAPPAFLVHAMDDDVCHYTESSHYAEALQRRGVEVEMHLFPRGGHGFGAGRASDGTSQWLGLAADWLRRFGGG
jgi:acetyl esterase/lipase